MDTDKKIWITISCRQCALVVSFPPINLSYGTDPSYKLKKSHSNVHEAEQSSSEYPHQSRELALHSERMGVGRALPALSAEGFSLSLCLFFTVSHPLSLSAL